MILVDTSVWVDHLRRGNPGLRQILDADEVLCHPFVIGELACGQMKQRSQILSLLQALPQAGVLGDAEVLLFVEAHRLMGAGLGWVDVHLLAAAAVEDASLWSLDRRLARSATQLGVSSSTVKSTH